MSTYNYAVLYYGYTWTEDVKDDGEWRGLPLSKAVELLEAEGDIDPVDKYPGYPEEYDEAALAAWREAHGEEERAYWGRLHKVEQRLLAGCHLDTYQNYGDKPDGMYVCIRTRDYAARQGDPGINLGQLDVDPDWEDALRQCCENLGLDVAGMTPSWHLATNRI